jgi:class 3 adenylate cyclase
MLDGAGHSEEAKRLAAEVKDRDGVELQLRIGLNSGQVVAGDTGSRAFGYTAIGEQVGLTQRMESVAPAGGVMLSESAARLVHVAVMDRLMEQPGLDRRRCFGAGVGRVDGWCRAGCRRRGSCSR